MSIKALDRLREGLEALDSRWGQSPYLPFSYTPPGDEDYIGSSEKLNPDTSYFRLTAREAMEIWRYVAYMELALAYERSNRPISMTAPSTGAKEWASRLREILDDMQRELQLRGAAEGPLSAGKDGE